MSTRVPGLPTCWRVLPIIPPRGYTSYCRGTGTGLRPPLTPPDPQLRWPTQFYVIDPSLAPGYRPRPGGTPRMDTKILTILPKGWEPAAKRQDCTEDA